MGVDSAAQPMEESVKTSADYARLRVAEPELDGHVKERLYRL